ncbi:MAG: hypothetical protein QME96_05820 [Myxococcota bacterium]|nr:hypothetical protein [Myxococcota bacterium]
MAEPTTRDLIRVVALDRLDLVRQDMMELQLQLARKGMLPELQKRLGTWSETVSDATQTLKETAPERP